jgi:limonene 1,2-monooxygenase
VQAHEWADPAATRRSYELLAQYVMPHFQGSARRPEESKHWVISRRPDLMTATGGAILSAIQKHADEQTAGADPRSADEPPGDVTTPGATT